MINLNFQVTHTYDYPPHEPRDPLGQTAMTVCKRFGDPALAFLTQTGYEDEVVYLSLVEDVESARHDTPVNRDVVAGMGYNPITQKIWCGSVTSNASEVFAFDPDTGLEVSSQDLSADDSLLGGADGFGTNGFIYTRARWGKVELRAMNGTKLGEKTFTDGITGISHSPWSWLAVKKNEHKVIVINMFGDVIADCDGLGSAPVTIPFASNEGMQAVAYDYVSDQNSAPQVWLPGGMIGDPGTIHHPDTPWDPEPWLFRHRIYVANNTDRTIYAGYFTEA